MTWAPKPFRPASPWLREQAAQARHEMKLRGIRPEEGQDIVVPSLGASFARAPESARFTRICDRCGARLRFRDDSDVVMGHARVTPSIVIGYQLCWRCAKSERLT